MRGATLLLFLLTLAQVGVFGLNFVISIAVTAAHLMVKRWLQFAWRACSPSGWSAAGWTTVATTN